MPSYPHAQARDLISEITSTNSQLRTNGGHVNESSSQVCFVAHQ